MAGAYGGRTHLRHITLFEIFHERGDAFRTHAELFTPNGFFIKTSDVPTPVVINKTGKSLRIGGIVMSNNTFSGCRIGIWLKSNGSLALGVR